MITDAEFDAWMADSSAERDTLVRVTPNVSGTDTQVRASVRGYAEPGLANPTRYPAILSTGVRFTEKLALTLGGSASLSSGDLELANPDGVRDEFLDYVWDNRTIEAWVGSPTWALSDYRQIFRGTVAGIAAKGVNRLTLKLRDQMQRLNTALSETRLGGTTSEKDSLIPQLFGECHNVRPLQVNPATRTYQVHGGQVAEIAEVRDNGIPIANATIGWAAVSVDLANGKFTLADEPAGVITASVRGDAPGGVYASTVADIIKRIVTAYGKAEDRLTTADIDLANFAAFNTLCPQPVGYYARERVNVLEVCQKLAASVGAQLVMSNLGQLRLLRVALPATGTPVFNIQPRHIRKSSELVVSEVVPVQASVQLGFCHNWEDQDNLQTAIPAEHKELFAKPWLTETVEDAAVKALYRLTALPPQQDTYLLRRVDATPEAQRRLDLWKVPRRVYEFEGYAALLKLQLGDTVTLTNPRYGLQNGKVGVVVTRSPNWDNSYVKLGVLI